MFEWLDLGRRALVIFELVLLQSNNDMFFLRPLHIYVTIHLRKSLTLNYLTVHALVRLGISIYVLTEDPCTGRIPQHV